MKTLIYRLAIFGTIGGWWFTLPQNPIISLWHWYQGDRALHTGDTPRAILSFRRAWKADSLRPENQYNLGWTYWQEQEIPHARQIWQKSLSNTSANIDSSLLARFYTAIGTSFLHEKQVDSAIHYLRKALKLYPEDTIARKNLSYALQLRRPQNQPHSQSQQNQPNPSHPHQQQQQQKQQQEQQQQQQKHKKDQHSSSPSQSPLNPQQQTQRHNQKSPPDQKPSQPDLEMLHQAERQAEQSRQQWYRQYLRMQERSAQPHQPPFAPIREEKPW